MRIAVILLMAITLIAVPTAATDLAETRGGRWVQTPYQQQNVLFDFYFDEPEKINSALYWFRSQMNPLMDDPYNQAPEFMNTVVVIHGTKIATAAHKNYDRYKDAVERMHYYADLGIKFKVCSLAAAGLFSDHTHRAGEKTHN